MIFRLNLLLWTAVLAALLLHTSGAPVHEGEEGGEKNSELLKKWKALADVAHLHKAQFEDGLEIDPIYLESCKSTSFPVKCPESNSSKESCFQTLAQGLLVYMVLLKHVEKEYPHNPVVSAAKSYSKDLIQLIKDNMRHGDQIMILSSTQELDLLKDYNTPDDSFYRKMSAHCILHHFKTFLSDGKRAIAKRERTRSNTL